MSIFNRTAAKAALAVATFGSVCAAADLAVRAHGPMAGYELIVVVFAACWIVHRYRPLMHPLSQRPREPQIPAQAGNTSPEPARPDLLPVL